MLIQSFHLKFCSTSQKWFWPSLFNCFLSNSLHYLQVGWVRSDSKAILSLHNSVITYDSRITLSGDFASTFNLHIGNIQEEDRGQYMCQINTDPMMFQTATLDVNVPPDIGLRNMVLSRISLLVYFHTLWHGTLCIKRCSKHFLQCLAWTPFQYKGSICEAYCTHFPLQFLDIFVMFLHDIDK